MLPPNKEPKELRPRAAVAAAIVVVLFIVLAARLYQLQLVRGWELSAKSRENYVKELVEPADRGFILDHRGRVLAGNRPSFDIYITPAFCKQKEEVIGRLAQHLNMSQEEAAQVLKAVRSMRRLERFRPYLVKLDVERDQLDVVEADLPNLEGVDMIPSPHRRYGPLQDTEANRPFGPMLAHVVGYMSEVSPKELEDSKGKYRRGDFIGRRGIERSYENELRGVDGKRFIAVDAKGRELDKETQDQLIPEEERRLPSTPGHNVVLSLDLGLQTIAERALKANGRAGSVAVVDIHTGFVLSLVSYPSYDPNVLTGRISRKMLRALVEDPMQPLFARATQQHYHPGSTFKVVTALAALGGDVVGPENSTSCGGGYSLGARRWRCHKDSGHGGGINLRRSLILSCDTYYYWLSDRMGLDPISEMARRMGFGKQTGIELSPEAPGLVPTVAFHDRVDKGYSKGFALNAAIGQGAVNVTVLQLVMAYAAIANGGTLYRPRLVRRIEDADGKVLREIGPEVVSTLNIKPAHLASVMDGLEAVVGEPGGTAYSKRLAEVRVAGKTGTAQNVVIGEKRLKEEEMRWEERDHAWFASVAPAEQPEIAVVVLNEHGGHGGSSAAPIAMAVIQGYFDLKRRESTEVLSAQEIADLQPNARFASQATMARLRAEPAPGGAAPAADEPASSPAEVANPEMLLEPRTPPESGVAHDVEARPSPE